MGISASSANVEPGAQPTGHDRRLLRRSKRRNRSILWYIAGIVAVGFLIVLAQVALYVRRAEPRDTRAILDRELRLNTLRPGEQVVRTVRVFRRNGTEYFRRTRGILVLTDRRLIYLGVPPRDVTGASDAPAIFDQREFPIDTLVHLKSSFAVLGLSRAIKVDSPDGDVVLGVASGGWPQAKLLRQAWDARHKRLMAIGVWGERVREARTHLQKELEEYAKRPVYHTVRPGDALGSIATWYETTTEEIQKANNLTGNKIKVGQQLLIRPRSG
jgi:hypothetical protein